MWTVILIAIGTILGLAAVLFTIEKVYYALVGPADIVEDDGEYKPS